MTPEAHTPTFGSSVPEVILEGPCHESGGVQYDVTRDRRLLVLKPLAGAGAALTIEVVLNWHEELKRLVPTAPYPRAEGRARLWTTGDQLWQA